MNIATANRLVQYRKQRGLSQEELAAELGLSRQAVSKWERAEASPDTDNLIALARLYGVSLDTLLLADGPIPSPAPATAASSEVFMSEPPPAAPEPDIDAVLEREVTRQINAEISKAFQEETPAGTHRKLSPAARRLLDLMLLGAFAVFMIVYGLLSFVFPPLLGAYPIICTIIYLLLGFFADWWHPGWMVYLSIPIFYIFFG